VIGNDGLVVCDICTRMPADPVPGPNRTHVELWSRWISGLWGPERRHDSGFHVCLACLRAMFAEQYANELPG